MIRILFSCSMMCKMMRAVWFVKVLMLDVNCVY